MRPLIPPPWVTALAVILTLALVINIFATGAFPTYNGTQGTYVLGGLVAGVLGLPFGFAIFRRDSGSTPPEVPPKPQPPAAKQEGS